MYQPLAVRVVKSQGHLPGDLAGIGHRQPPAAADQGRQVPAFHVFHYQEAKTGVLAGVGRGDQVDVVQAAYGLDFARKSLQGLTVGGPIGPQHLQRHQPLQSPVPGLVDHAHAAPTQLLNDLIIAQERRHYQGHRSLAGVGRSAPHEAAANGRGVGWETLQIIFHHRLLARDLAVPDLDCQQFAKQIFAHIDFALHQKILDSRSFARLQLRFELVAKRIDALGASGARRQRRPR